MPAKSQDKRIVRAGEVDEMVETLIECHAFVTR